MNKYQKAHGLLWSVLKYEPREMIDEERIENLFCLSVLKELVDKATPKNVEKQEHLYDVDDEYVGTRGKCPACQKWLLIESGGEYKCCQYCGQALDWSEEE